MFVNVILFEYNKKQHKKTSNIPKETVKLNDFFIRYYKFRYNILTIFLVFIKYYIFKASLSWVVC